MNIRHPWFNSDNATYPTISNVGSMNSQLVSKMAIIKPRTERRKGRVNSSTKVVRANKPLMVVPYAQIRQGTILALHAMLEIRDEIQFVSSFIHSLVCSHIS